MWGVVYRKALFGNDSLLALLAVVLVGSGQPLHCDERVQRISQGSLLEDVYAQIEKRVERVGVMLANLAGNA